MCVLCTITCTNFNPNLFDLKCIATLSTLHGNKLTSLVVFLIQSKIELILFCLGFRIEVDP